MPTFTTFRISTYLALAMSCIALGYSESDLLTEVAYFALICVLVLTALYFLESRVNFLSISSANLLGVLIILLYGLWVFYRIKRELLTAEFFETGWTTLIVALCGPLVMFVLVAKVARRDKHAGDYWTLHGIALAGVGLSAVLAEEVMSFVLIGLYLLATVWSLTLLHLCRTNGLVPPIPGGRQPARKALAVSRDPTGHRTELGPAIIWASLALLIAVPIYLVTPHAAQVELGRSRLEIGYSAEQMMNLNRTGSLKANPEPAFEFSVAYPDGTPKTDFDLEQRWRGRTLRIYSNGEWNTTDELLPRISYAGGPWEPNADTQIARRRDPWTPPDLGPDQFIISFDIPGPLRGVFLADPVIWKPNQQPPLASQTPNQTRGWQVEGDGSFTIPSGIRSRQGGARRYYQVYQSSSEPDVSPPFRFVDPDFQKRLEPLLYNSVPRVKEFADAVLMELEQEGRLPKEWRDEVTLLPKLIHHETIAKLFVNYLSNTPSLSYTTEIQRENKNVDPIEDFLFYSKSGHCERFATALALMLRSQGIPSVVVHGFKGCENIEDGKYVVRHDHAHTWVESLVPKTGEPFDPRVPQSMVYHWRSLDPTPGGENFADGESLESWWQQATSWISLKFKKYITEYSPERRNEALSAIGATLRQPESLIVLGVLVGSVIVLRVAAKRSRNRKRFSATAQETATWYYKLVSLLSTYGIAPASGQTAREFAAAAAAILHSRGFLEVAIIPVSWAEAYYQDRFGGVPPTAAEYNELESGLESLRKALAT